MHILIDQDSTIADWGKQYDADLDAWNWSDAQELEELSGIPRTANQQAFNLHGGMTQAQSMIISEIMDRPNFYAELEPIDGAIDALHRLANQGHKISIVTSPWLSNPTCVQDKIDWVEKYLGAGWADHMVITKDKTLIYGDILIDDKPEITGFRTPTWEHVIFDQPYNRHVQGDGRAVLRYWEDVDLLVEGLLNKKENVYA